MKIHKLEYVTRIDAQLETVWQFFSSPKNLQKITPKEMKFTIIDTVPGTTFQGQIIRYNISPFLGIQFSWMTEITALKEKEYFIDEQRFGPYKFWHHTHAFKEYDGYVEMKDTLLYAFHGGGIGDIIQHRLLKTTIENIFTFRESVIQDIFKSGSSLTT